MTVKYCTPLCFRTISRRLWRGARVWSYALGSARQPIPPLLLYLNIVLTSQLPPVPLPVMRVQDVTAGVI